MKLHHVAITVNDMQESIDFYCKNFGLLVAQEFARPGNWEAIFLKGENMNIELFKFVENSEIKNNTEELNIVGIRHIAFEVQDLEKEIASRPELVFEPIKDGASGRRFAFTRDPNGVQIEFYEVKEI